MLLTNLLLGIHLFFCLVNITEIVYTYLEQDCSQKSYYLKITLENHKNTYIFS